MKSVKRPKYLLLLSLLLCGCFHPTPIQGYHWKCSLDGMCDLYDANNEQAASLLPSVGGASAQACVFVLEASCHYFETEEQGMEYIMQTMGSKK